MARTGPLESLLIVALGGAFVGCGGGGGGGDGGGATFVPTGTMPSIRPDIRTGASAPSVSLQDQQAHVYTFPAAAGATFMIEVDTQPTGQPVTVVITELVASANGTGQPTSTTLVGATGTPVTTPYVTSVTATGDSTINVAVFDQAQNNLTLSRMSAIALQQSSDTSSIKAFVHVAGDDADFVGFSGAPGNAPYNDLATIADKQRLVADLLDGVNAIWAQTGVQIDVGGSGFTAITNAQVQAADPSLLQNGITVLDAGDLATNVPARRWGNLGIPASDPNFGRAVDVFLVVQGVPVAAGGEVKGYSAGVRLRSQGGILEGAGLTHAVVMPLFNLAGDPVPLSELVGVLTHELGHFMSLLHTTEPTFVPDDLSTTPFATLANDTNGNGLIDGGDVLAAYPDYLNLMFPLASGQGGQDQLVSEQGRAMRAYLAIRAH